MEKPNILVSGATIANDRILIRKLENFSNIFSNSDNTRIESIITNHKIDLILLEISNDSPVEVELIKSIKSRFPEMEIVLVDGNGDQEVLARAFAYGAKDAFRKPYKVELIVERMEVLLFNNRCNC